MYGFAVQSPMFAPPEIDFKAFRLRIYLANKPATVALHSVKTAGAAGAHQCRPDKTVTLTR
jgi:hypothetical protein